MMNEKPNRRRYLIEDEDKYEDKEGKKEEAPPLEASSERKRANSILNQLLATKKKLSNRATTAEELIPLTDSIIEIGQLIRDFDTTVSEKQGLDEYRLAEIRLFRKTTEQLEQLYSVIKPPTGLGVIFSGYFFKDIMAPSATRTMLTDFKTLLTNNYFHLIEESQRDEFLNNSSDYLAAIIINARQREAKAYEKMHPLEGSLIAKAFIRKSTMGSEDKGEVKQVPYFTGKIEAQSTNAVNALDYLMAAVASGLMKGFTMVGPFATLQGSLFMSYSMANWGQTIATGVTKAAILPKPDELLNLLEQAKHDGEKNIAYLFKGLIPSSQIKEISVLSQDKTVNSAFWDPMHENNFNLYKNQVLTDPFQVIYIVVPAESSRLDKENQNEWKLAFFNLDHAKAFVDAFKKHPYWYDETKGWNLNGWPEKTHKIDLAIMAIEDVLRTYLSPGINIDFDIYFQQGAPLPIQKELELLFQLVQTLQTLPNQNDDENLEAALKEIDSTFQKIDQSLEGQDYGLRSALQSIQEYVDDKFDFRKSSSLYV